MVVVLVGSAWWLCYLGGGFMSFECPPMKLVEDEPISSKRGGIYRGFDSFCLRSLRLKSEKIAKSTCGGQAKEVFLFGRWTSWSCCIGVGAVLEFFYSAWWVVWWKGWHPKGWKISLKKSWMILTLSRYFHNLHRGCEKEEGLFSTTCFLYVFQVIGTSNWRGFEQGVFFFVLKMTPRIWRIKIS